MLVNRAESHTSGARFVRCGRTWRLTCWKKTPLPTGWNFDTQLNLWQLTKSMIYKNAKQSKTLTNQNKIDSKTRWLNKNRILPERQITKSQLWQTKTKLDSKTCWPTANYFYQNLCQRRYADFENLQKQPRTKPKKRTFAKLTWPKETPNNHKPKLTRTLTNGKTKIEKTKLNLENR